MSHLSALLNVELVNWCWCVHADESDARHGAYDFYAEQVAAPDDLKHLTDQYESMAFRRRGP